MLQSKLFTKTRKEAPADEVSKNAKLLIKGGFIDKLQAGVYTYLPLGFRVLKNIERIIREEMDKAGGQELLMPALHPRSNWEKTGRWSSMNDLIRIPSVLGEGTRHPSDIVWGNNIKFEDKDLKFVLGPTHEEVVVPLAKQFISSYRDLPLAVYQIQDKFRMELRAKSGILRGREFIMKDLYSFHEDEKDLARYYEIMKEAYARVFARAGIGERTYLTYASGGTFSKYSHEFQTATDAGEDTIYVCEKCNVAINKEISGGEKKCPECGSTKLDEKKSIEVGNIFELKTKFSEPFELSYTDKEGAKKTVVMGCYGIGLGRLMGTIVEVLADERGIVWPKEVAPYDVHLLLFSSEDSAVEKEANALYERLQNEGIHVLYDERKGASAGEKFADADLIGIPYRAVISEKSMKAGGIEVKGRTDEKAAVMGETELFSLLKK